MQEYIDFLPAAQRYLDAIAEFERQSRLSVDKANELLSAVIVNQWFVSQGVDMRIQLLSRTRGPDGKLLIAGDDSGKLVEFKSSKQGSNPEFWFKPTFDFAAHGCVVMTEFAEGRPQRVYIAIGAATMQVLSDRLLDDKYRNSFKHGDLLRLFALDRAAKLARRQRRATIGLRHEPLPSTNTTDRLVILEQPAIDDMLKQCTAQTAIQTS